MSDGVIGLLLGMAAKLKKKKAFPITGLNPSCKLRAWFLWFLYTVYQPIWFC